MLFLMNHRFLWLSLLLTLLSSSVAVSSDSSSADDHEAVFGSFQWFCDLQYEPIVELEWNPVANTYKLLGDQDEERVSYDQDDDETRQRRRTLLVGDKKMEFASVSALRGTYDNDEYQHLERALFTYTHNFDDDNNNNQSQVDLTNITLDSHSQTNSTGEDEEDPTIMNLIDHNQTGTIIVQARRCPCWEDPYGTLPQHSKDFYCPSYRSHCGLGATAYTRDGKNSLTVRPVTSLYVDEPGCLDLSSTQNFSRNVWPIVTVWYLAMSLCLFLTRPGRHAIGCCLSYLWPRWNVWAVNRIMRTHPDLTNRIVIRRQMAESGGFEVTFEWTSARNNNNAGNGNGNNNNNSNNNGGGDRREEVLLRAKTFHYNEKEQPDPATGKANQGVTELEEPISDGTLPAGKGSDPESPICVGASEFHDHKKIDDDDIDEDLYISCAICHTEIEEGARVGDLPCNHVLHIECLKTWILRRNVCPLCLTANIATPRRQTATTTTNSSDSTSQAQRPIQHPPRHDDDDDDDGELVL